MLILAGVSINAIVGDNGVLTKAKAASIASRKAAILEELNLELASYNIDSILNNPEQTTTMLGNLINNGLIDTVLSLSSEYVANASEPMGIPQFDDANNYTGYIDYAVKKENYSIIISVDDNGIYKAEYGDINISSGGSVAGGTTLVTDKAFNNNNGASPEEQGKFVISNDASVMFVDEISGELSIQVKSGIHAKVYAFKDMTLTNEGIKRSAIDIEPGGTLDLFVVEGATVTVNSGFGEKGETTGELGAKGGPGGYAGIHVPENAKLILAGSGTVIACGGDAGSGGGAISDNTGGGGGGGAGAGIGGNGGAGGNANVNCDGQYHVYGSGGSGACGENGESAGSINIKSNITVIAYGGAGAGAGGSENNSSGYVNSGGGGGGYPAAGIGGGGAGGGGGDHMNAGGGYSGGSGEPAIIGAQNGLASHQINRTSNHINGGGGYYERSTAYLTDGSYFEYRSWFGQGGPDLDHIYTSAGCGGYAGNGGNVVVSQNCIVNAYNGNMITNGDYTTVYYEYEKDGAYKLNNGNKIKLNVLTKEITNLDGTKTISQFIPAKIFAQTGIQREVWGTPLYMTSEMKSFCGIAESYSAHTIEKVRDEQVIPSYGQGIGSGAGYIELSNGTFKVDPSMN